MRLIVSILAIICSSAALGMSQARTGLDARIVKVRVPALPTPCDGHAIAQAIARSANIAVGFEDLPECTAETYPARVSELHLRPLPPAESDTALPDGFSTRNALDWLTKAIPAFEWRDIDGIANVRPKDAWTSPDDLLNLPMAPFQAFAVDVDQAVSQLFSRAPLSAPPTENLFDLTFAGGVVVDGLNNIVRLSHAAGWDAITIAHPTDWPETDPVASIAVRRDPRDNRSRDRGGIDVLLSAKTFARLQ